MNEPIYRWECTICDAAGVAESSEMARLAVDTHVAVAHPGDARARRPAAGERPAAPGSERTA